MASLIEQAAERLEQLRQAGVVIPPTEQMPVPVATRERPMPAAASEIPLPVAAAVWKIAGGLRDEESSNVARIWSGRRLGRLGQWRRHLPAAEIRSRQFGRQPRLAG